MRKKDVKTEAFLDWNEYADKEPDHALEAIYSHASDSAKARCAWYWKSIRTKRRASLAARFATFLLLAGGTLLPILAGLGEKADIRLYYTQIGVAALAFAGLLQVADRVFGWSSGWLRYMSTVTGMEGLGSQFELDWASYLIGKDGALQSSDVRALFDIAKRLEVELAKRQSDETDKWITEFNSSMALLSELIKSQRETSEKTVEAARAAIVSKEKAEAESAKALKPGAIELRLSFTGKPTPIDISLDGEAAEEFRGTLWSRLGLEPRQHELRIRTRDDPPLEIRKPVEVTAGAIASVDIKLA